MTAPRPPDDSWARDPEPRRRRMNRSRAIAAGTSVGALVALTAGVAVANPGSHSSPPTAAADPSSQQPSAGRAQTPGTDDSGWPRDDDSGWWGTDDGSDGSVGRGSSDPNSGFVPTPRDQGGSTFDPGSGNGSSTRSGGS